MRDRDPLMVQVSLTIKAPKGAVISRRVLDQILERMVERRTVPKNVIVRGIYWRNPNRRGSAGAWRWHADRDKNDPNAPQPLEASPREQRWEDTIPSLGEFLLSASVSF